MNESGFLRQCWSTSGPIREIFKGAFAVAGLPYFNPHSLRKTLVRLAMEFEIGDEAMKAWSQNLGHDDVQTTYRSYGELPAHRQRDLMRSTGKRLGDENDEVLALAMKLAATARAKDWIGADNDDLCPLKAVV